MHADLRFTEAQFHELRDHLLPDDAEHAAILICGLGGSESLLLCREVIALTDDDLEPGSGRLHLRVSPLALARAAKQAARQDCTLVVCHSHPFPGPVRASNIDIQTETELCGRVLPGRLAGRPAGALILGPDGTDGRIWREGRPDRLFVTVGGALHRRGVLSDLSEMDDRDSRQLLVWGSEGQRLLRRSSVAVVGAGGTGSHVVTQLAHLGIGRFVIVDHDRVERSNLSRLVGATADDVGRPKLDVLGDAAIRIRADVGVERIDESLLDWDTKRLAECDIVVGCTDTHGSRALLTELSAQYHLPFVDLGVEVQGAGEYTRAGGGVRVIRPGGPCLHCMRVLDSSLVREEFLTDSERSVEAERGYLRGVSVPEPSVISLNGVVGSLACVEVIDILLGLFAGAPRRLLYRAERRAVSTASVARDEGCYVCGRAGIAGLGDGRALPRRTQGSLRGSAACV